VKKLKVFISSVQNEFTKERKELADYLRHDPLLGTFYEPFLFEEVPANTNSRGKIFIEEVKESDVFIGLLGESYGFEDEAGISPTSNSSYSLILYPPVLGAPTNSINPFSFNSFRYRSIVETPLVDMCGNFLSFL
jgi:hypothetical protein